MEIFPSTLPDQHPDGGSLTAPQDCFDPTRLDLSLASGKASRMDQRTALRGLCEYADDVRHPKLWSRRGRVRVVTLGAATSRQTVIVVRGCLGGREPRRIGT